MNFKLNKIAIALPLAAIALTVNASKPVGETATYAATAMQQSLKAKAAAKYFGNKYIVLLKDEPLALYQGGIKGLIATNIKASKQVNANAEGKLDLSSNASIVYSNYLALQQNKTLQAMQSKLNRTLPLLQRHKVALNAVVLELEAHEVATVRKIAGVAAVEKESFNQLLTDVGPEHVGAPIIWDNPEHTGTSMGEGLVVGVIDTGIASYKKKWYSWSTPDQAAFNPSFADIGGDGYDHSNPNGAGSYFGDCVDSPFWCNDKLIGVVSFPGLEVGPTNVYSSDRRYLTGQDDQGHGSHVASTVAGNILFDVPYTPAQYSGNEKSPWELADSTIKVNMSGVAPHANIVSYRVCLPSWGCSVSGTLQAVEHAIENNIDVINYSVGGSATSPWYSVDALAMLSAREANIHVAVAAGNSGPAAGSVGTPGNSPWVTGVAALTHGRDYTDEKTAVFTGGANPLPEMTGKGKTIALESPTEILYAGDIESTYYQGKQGGPGYCYASAYGSGALPSSIAGKVVVCRRGGEYGGVGLSRLNKSIAAKYRGAAGLILINSDENVDNIVGDFHAVPTVHLNKADGDNLLAWLAEGQDHMVSILGDSEFNKNEAEADIAAVFTSRGPDNLHKDYLVPSVGAPGADIYASNIGTGMHARNEAKIGQIPGDNMQISGTSMASPHIAGMYVLMKAVHPEWSSAEAQSALMMTANTTVSDKQYRFDENGNVLRDENGLSLFDLVRSSHHTTGSGSARVNAAVQAGLVLDESIQGYLAANPFAQTWEQESIIGWHGEPHQMNIASLSKGKCLIECNWTRTFKAVKDATWTVSFESFDNGFELSADQTSFTLSSGEEVRLNITAIANSALAKSWVDGRMILTADDSSIPVQTLPITINYIAGLAPEEIDITATRDNDSAAIKGISTIGTDELQTSKSGLAKADVYEFELMRDATNGSILGSVSTLDETVFAIPLNIQADSKRVVLEVLETTSPDLDMYVGIDADLSGDPTGYPAEMGLIVYMSASPSAYEKIDLIEPRNDTYWLLVHNWAEGPAPLAENQMVCAEGQEADEGKECAQAPILDTVKIAVTTVAYDEDNMTLSVPTSVQPREEVNTRVNWDQPMAEGDTYHGVFWLGTTDELNRNIGAVKVNIGRGSDDVKVAAPLINENFIISGVTIEANNSGEDRAYQLTMELAENITVATLIADVNTVGVAQLMATEDIAYSIDRNVLIWDHNQVNGAPAIDFTIVLNATNVIGLADVNPVLISNVNTSSVAQYHASPIKDSLFFYGRPTYSAATQQAVVKEKEMVQMNATIVDAVIDNTLHTYTWKQLAGPSVDIIGNGSANISFAAPKVHEDTQIIIEMTGNNGSKNAEPVQLMVDVENKSSGGAFGFSILILLGFAGIRRRST